MMSGVRDVLSFDAKEVYLETEQGILLIKGDELHVNRLSLEKGEVDVDGRIDSFAYSDKNDPEKKATSFLGRMFQGDRSFRNRFIFRSRHCAQECF